MKPAHFLLNLLNVRKNEWLAVKQLFIFQFFQGAGIAFFFTAAFALFLQQFSITELPKVLIGSAFLLWLGGILYSKLEPRLSVITLAKYITIFTASSFILFRLGIGFMPPYFLYFMLAWFNLLYLLNNLEFWGIASLIFDIRQSKRLFSVISAGDIPAKFIGYTIALLLVGVIGTANLLWAGLACTLGSFPFLLLIERSGHIHAHARKTFSPAAAGVAFLAKKIAANVLVRRIAILTIISSATFIIINYTFYGKIQQAFSDDVQLAQFIAFFFAIARIVALFIKTIFTGRLINRLGIIRSLLITPGLMIIMVGIALLAGNFITGKKIDLYLFAGITILIDVLRSTINSPVFLTLMQPLTTHERLRAHTITKGIMDPFASLLAGGVLLIFLYTAPDIPVSTLNITLLTLGILWVIGIYRIHKQYLKTLLTTIDNKFFRNREFSITDASAIHWLKARINIAGEQEALNILHMLSVHHVARRDEIVGAALQHHSVKVKTETIRIADDNTLRLFKDDLTEILKTNPDPHLVAEAIKALAKIGEAESDIFPFIYDKESLVQISAITAILSKGKEEARLHGKNFLLSMIDSKDAGSRKTAAAILKELPGSEYTDLIFKLLKDENQQVQKAAFYAASKSADPGLLQLIITNFSLEDKLVLDTLYKAGVRALTVLHSTMIKGSYSMQHGERLLRLIGRIGGKKSYGHLVDLLHRLPVYRSLIIQILYQEGFKAGKEEQTFFEANIHKYLGDAISILYMQHLLLRHPNKYNLLFRALELELLQIRDNLLYLFAVTYDREKIKDVRAAFSTGSKESVANAMEIIELTVKKQFADLFNIIYETSEIGQRIAGLSKLYPDRRFTDVEHVLTSILEMEDFSYHHWTKACSLYTSRVEKHFIDKRFIRKYKDAEHPLLKEAAEYAM